MDRGSVQLRHYNTTILQKIFHQRKIMDLALAVQKWRSRLLYKEMDKVKILKI